MRRPACAKPDRPVSNRLCGVCLHLSINYHFDAKIIYNRLVITGYTQPALGTSVHESPLPVRSRPLRALRATHLSGLALV